MIKEDYCSNRVSFVNVTENNLEEAYRIQRILFPNYDAYQSYLNSLQKEINCRYWIIQQNSRNVGVSGIYVNYAEPESAWLGWFGILPEYRRQYLGTKSLELFENEAKSLNFKYVRLYTDRNFNDIAKSFYIQNNYLEEFYNDEISIFSKSICNAPVPAWKNKRLRY